MTTLADVDAATDALNEALCSAWGERAFFIEDQERKIIHAYESGPGNECAAAVQHRCPVTRRLAAAAAVAEITRRDRGEK